MAILLNTKVIRLVVRILQLHLVASYSAIFYWIFYKKNCNRNRPFLKFYRFEISILNYSNFEKFDPLLKQ